MGAPAKESKYAKDLVQEDNGVKISPNPSDWVRAERHERKFVAQPLGRIHRFRPSELGWIGGTGAAKRHAEEMLAQKKYLW